MRKSACVQRWLGETEREKLLETTLPTQQPVHISIDEL